MSIKSSQVLLDEALKEIKTISPSEALKLSTPWIASTFTSSNFQPYITTINLYQDGCLLR